MRSNNEAGAKAPAKSRRPWFDQNNRTLFLTVAFPIHFWSIFAQLFQTQDITFWEIIGRAGYALLFAFFESCLVFLVVWLVWRLMSRYFEQKLAMSLVTWLYLVLAAATMLNQGFSMMDMSPGTFWFRLFGLAGRHQQTVIPILLMGVLLVVLAPVISLIRSPKILRSFLEGLKRLSILSLFYLALDAAGLLVVILRNIIG